VASTGEQSSEKIPGRRQIGVSLDDEHAVLLGRIADSLTDGRKSLAVELLLDMYGGKILERALQEREIALAPPLEVTRWQAPKLELAVIAYIAGLVRAGNMPEVACQMAGVPPRLRSQWFKRGRNDRSAGRQSLYADLVAAVERAEAECESEDIARLRAHGRQTWTALAWRLERQYPDRYAQRKRIDGKVQHSVFPVVDWDRLTPAETRMLVELLRKASPELDDPGVSRTARPALELLPADVIDGEALDHEQAEKPDA
jgi:hypothetical protein